MCFKYEYYHELNIKTPLINKSVTGIAWHFYILFINDIYEPKFTEPWSKGKHL